jgi:hypothetical protein
MSNKKSNKKWKKSTKTTPHYAKTAPHYSLFLVVKQPPAPRIASVVRRSYV